MLTGYAERSRAGGATGFQRLRDLIGHKTTVTALYLYVVHFLNYLLPAINVGLLTRKLSPPSYGRLIIAQSLGYTVATLAEYGFQWTGSRAVAESARDADLGTVVVSVGSAKLLIAVACVIFIPIYSLCIPSMAGYTWLLISGYIWGVIQGNDLQWYFLGRERLRGYLAVDVLMRALSVTFIVLLIRDDRDASSVMFIQSACTLCVSIWAARRIATEVKLTLPTMEGILGVMHDGRTLFLQRLARYASTSANIALLGMVAAPADVGFFGSADKIVRYSSSLSVPITQIVYPKISRAVANSGERRAARIARLAGIVSLVMAAAASVTIFTMPRLIILVLFGAKMLPALPTLRILAVFPVLSSVTTSLVFYWLLPKRLESISLKVIALAGAVNVISIVVLGRVWHQTGAASAVVLTEVITIMGYLWALRLGAPVKSRGKARPDGVERQR